MVIEQRLLGAEIYRNAVSLWTDVSLCERVPGLALWT